jgi:hypothetical protein
VVEHRAVIEALVALFKHRSHNAAIGTPRGVVVDLGPTSLRPEEDLQGVGVIRAVADMGYVPIPDLSFLLQERALLAGSPPQRAMRWLPWLTFLEIFRTRRGSHLRMSSAYPK